MPDPARFEWEMLALFSIMFAMVGSICYVGIREAEHRIREDNEERARRWAKEDEQARLRRAQGEMGFVTRS